MEVRYQVLSEIGKVRTHNEDNFGIDENTPNGRLYIVCDGMGGHVGGAVASALAVKSIIEYFNKEVYDNLILAIDKAFQFANEQIFVHTLADPALKGMGTTAVILVIKNEDCFIGHVGDSRIYLKSEGRLHRLTKDHSYVQGLVDSGTITDEAAEKHPQKNQILKALGHAAEVRGTVCDSAIKVQQGDVFMLCSDGLNGMLSDSVMQEMIDGDDLSLSKKNLFNAAMDNGGTDNVSILLVQVISSSHYSQSVFRSYNPERSKVSDENDLYKTSHFPATESVYVPPQKKKKKIMLIIAAACLLIASGVAYHFMTRTHPLTKMDLGKLPFDSLKNLIKKTPNVDINDGNEMKTEDGKEVVLIIDNEKLVGVTEKTENSDRDEDGVADKDDKCPDEVGTAKYQGCPPPTNPKDKADRDKDGVLDDKDKCPDEVGTAKYQGCPPPTNPKGKADRDKDGVLDDKDKCPDEVGTAKYQGCPTATNSKDKADRDKDGVLDDKDKCPDEVGAAKNQGCPPTSGDALPSIITRAKDGNLQVRVNKDGETITQFRKRIKGIPGFQCKLSDPEDIIKLNNIKSNDERLPAGSWIKFKCN